MHWKGEPRDSDTRQGNHKQEFYVNYLRKWQERTCEVNAVIEDGDDIEEYQWSSRDEPQLGQQLSVCQPRSADYCRSFLK